MKTIHDGLANRFAWYRNWHTRPYVEEVHYFTLIVMAFVNLYLGIDLLSIISQA